MELTSKSINEDEDKVSLVKARKAAANRAYYTKQKIRRAEMISSVNDDKDKVSLVKAKKAAANRAYYTKQKIRRAEMNINTIETSRLTCQSTNDNILIRTWETNSFGTVK